MDERQTTEGKETSPAGANTQAGNQSEPLDLIERAHFAAERLEKANKEREALLEREERLEARRAIAGKSIGAQPQVEKKESTPREYANALRHGKVLDY